MGHASDNMLCFREIIHLIRGAGFPVGELYQLAWPYSPLPAVEQQLRVNWGWKSVSLHKLGEGLCTADEHHDAVLLLL
jgi:hypothetical protein